MCACFNISHECLQLARFSGLQLISGLFVLNVHCVPDTSIKLA
jgi:hypothetical protein